MGSARSIAILHLTFSLLVLVAVQYFIMRSASPLIASGAGLIVICLSAGIIYILARREASAAGMRNRANAALRISTLEAQRQFTARVSHELRTPLTIIKGENQVLMARRRSVEEHEAQIVSNLEEVEKMERIIDDLLIFSKYESGELDMPLRPVWLDEVAASVIKDLLPLASAKSVQILSDLAHLNVLGDHTSLERMVCKFLENAIQYTPPGGNVYVRLFESSGKKILEIQDAGIGIPKDDSIHVFERFYRAANARELRPSGGGVGLSLAKIIAELHSADISLQSGVGKGTTFSVIFNR